MNERTEVASRLEARDVRVYFGGVKAVDGVDLLLARTEILGLIGPNGAGKTTLVNVLTGFQRPTAGRVLMDGGDVTRESTERLARRGLVRTFQNIRLFSRLSVLENVELGAISVARRRSQCEEVAWDLLRVFGLETRAHAPAGSLPHGDARRLGIARALATHPRFLLLDEPASGLDEEESDNLVNTIRAIRGRFSCGVLLIEHVMRVIMQVCERIQVLNYGKTISIGTPDEIRENPAVIEAYLGHQAGQV